MRSLRKRCTGSGENSVAYRLDYRPPEIICRAGFAGTNHNWLNNIFSGCTVFASLSLRGISRFFLEAVLNRNVDGSRTPGALSQSRYLYPEGKKCYVYKIDLSGLKYVEVSSDLIHLNSSPDSSYIYRKLKKERDKEYKESDSRRLDDCYTDLKLRLSHYSNVAGHTEEILIRGPVSPGKISCYQQL